MTNREAIEIIKENLCIAYAVNFDTYAWALGEKDKEALRMALKALEKEG